MLADPISRRRALTLAAAAVAAMEAGRPMPALAENQFTMASTGGSWGDALAEAFVRKPDFAGRNGVTVAFAHQLESVAASKLLGSPADPPFSVTSHSPPDAVMMAVAGALQPYDPAVVTNYADIHPSATQAPQGGMDAWFGAINMSILGLVWNTKLARKPASWEELWKPEYKGRIAIPAYGWYGMHWLNAVNRMLGGTEADVSKGVQAVSDLVRKNQAIICQNADHGMRLLQQEEVVMMPYMNGRTHVLQEGGTPVEIEYVPFAYQQGTGFVVPKASRFPALAQRLINNTLDAELQLHLTQRLKYPPTNRKAQLPPALERYRIPDSAFERLVALDWRQVTANRAANLERWNRQIL